MEEGNLSCPQVERPGSCPLCYSTFEPRNAIDNLNTFHRVTKVKNGIESITDFFPRHIAEVAVQRSMAFNLHLKNVTFDSLATFTSIGHVMTIDARATTLLFTFLLLHTIVLLQPFSIHESHEGLLLNPAILLGKRGLPYEIQLQLRGLAFRIVHWV